jgi:NAD(P)-dependent dehydrogenase (short-subunit alcohol dehydrogenase family)
MNFKINLAKGDSMTFLITGAGRGLGLEFTTQLLANKKNVVAWVRNPEKATDLKNLEAQYTPHLKIQKVDITSAESIMTAVKELTTPIDVLINNAGVLLDSGEKFMQLSMKKIEDTFAVNVLAPMQVAQQVVPLLQKSTSPVLVNISSKMGSIDDNSSGGYYAYRMSKTAVNMFTKSFSIDFPNIKTLCVHPGWVRTDMGGSNAAITPQESVTGLLKIIFEHQRYKTGSFVNYSGTEIPW